MLRPLITLGLVLSCAPAAWSKASHPAFDLGACTHRATHVFAANSNARGDRLRVVESWQGDLAPGDELELTELRPLEAARGKRVIAFLVREGGVWRHASEGFYKVPATTPGLVRTSVVWIDGGVVKGLQSGERGSVVGVVAHYDARTKTFTPYTEATLRREWTRLRGWRTRFERAKALADPSKRGEALCELVTTSPLSRYWYASYPLIRDCGEAAWPHVQTALDTLLKDGHRGWGWKFVEIVESAAPPEAKDRLAAFLHDRLRAELAYWKRSAAKLEALPDGALYGIQRAWRDGETQGAVDVEIAVRYFATFHLVEALRRTDASRGKATFGALEAFWMRHQDLHKGYVDEVRVLDAIRRASV